MWFANVLSGVLIIGATTPLNGASPAPKELSILFGGDRRGEIAPCRCENAPLGGIDRQVTLVREWRQKEGEGSLLVLDGGDNFFPEPSATDPIAFKRAELVADGLGAMRHAVMVPGERDFAAGLVRFRELGARAHALWVVSNLKVAPGKLPMTLPYQMLRRGDQRILVLGVVGPESMPDALRLEGYKAQDPEAATLALVEQFKSEADLIVLVSHLGRAKAEKLAEKVNHPLLILNAHDGKLRFGASSVGKSQLVESPHSGKYLVRLHLRYRPGAPLVSGAAVQKGEREREELKRRLLDLENKPASVPASQPHTPREKGLLELQRQLAELEASPLFAEQSTIFYQLLPVDSDIPPDPTFAPRVVELSPP